MESERSGHIVGNSLTISGERPLTLHQIAYIRSLLYEVDIPRIAEDKELSCMITVSSTIFKQRVRILFLLLGSCVTKY